MKKIAANPGELGASEEPDTANLEIYQEVEDVMMVKKHSIK